MSTPTNAIEALQRALASEHAAVYLLASLDGRLSTTDDASLYDALQEAYDAHVAARDTLVDQVVAAGAKPVGSAAAYDLPAGAETPAGIRRAVLQLEQRSAATYLSLVAEVTGAQRRLLVTLLGDAAVRELSFGGTPQTFPGT